VAAAIEMFLRPQSDALGPLHIVKVEQLEWVMLKLVLTIMIIAVPHFGAIAQTPQLVDGWPYKTFTGDFSLFNIPSFSNDANGENRIYFGVIDHRVNSFRFNLTQPAGWPIECDSLLWSSYAIVADFDHDGKSECLIDGVRRVESPPDYLYTLRFLFDDNGLIMPGFPIQYIHPAAISTADLDGDNEYEIMHYSLDEGIIDCIDWRGQHKPGWPLVIPYDVSGSMSRGGGGAVGDLDLDGNNEYIIGGWYHIYAYRYDGTTQPGFPIVIPDSSYSFSNYNWAPTLADTDGDGYLEIIISTLRFGPGGPSSQMMLYSHNGLLENGWPLEFPSDAIRHAPTPSDINNDGQVEIGFQAGALYYVDSDANILPGWPVTLYQPDGRTRSSNSDIITVDINGDGNCEIFTDFNAIYPDSIGADSDYYYGHSYLFAIDHLGQPLPGYPVEVNGEYLNRPPTFWHDESSNQLFMGHFDELCLIPYFDIDTAYLSLYSFPDSTGPLTQWPRLSHDNLMTRNYNFVDRVTSVHDEGEKLPQSYVLKQNYPNPFNGETTIEYILPKQETVSLSLYDIMGRRIVELKRENKPAGTHKQGLTLSDFPSGVYFYTLETSQCKITRKMTVLK
jgi:hypothetical protein